METEVKDFSHYNDFFRLMKHYGDFPEGQMDLNEQLSRLSSMFQVSEHKMYVHDPECSDDVLISLPMFEIKDTKIKSRRIVKMGVYYFVLNPQFITDPPKAMLFYNKLEDGKLIKAHHPHINDNGTPCLGEFQRQTAELKQGNLIFTVKLAKKFLATHYYRSTFHRLNDNYDRDIIGTYKPAIQPTEDQEFVPAETKKIRVMGWELAHNIRNNHRNSSPSQIYLGSNVNAWIIEFMDRDHNFMSACSQIRSLIRSLEGIEGVEISSSQLEDLDYLASWSKYESYLRRITSLEDGSIQIEDEEVRSNYSSQKFVTVELNTDQKKLMSQFRRLRNSSNSHRELLSAPYPGEVSEEEMNYIIENSEWPERILKTDPETVKVYEEAIAVLEEVKVKSKQLTIKFLKKKLRELGGLNDEIKVSHPQQTTTTHTIPIEALPRF